MDRLSLLDAEFLHLEDDSAHLHIGGVCTFAGEPPSFAELRALVAAKLDRIPRYRQRVRPVPLELGRPVWVDDPHFRLDYHLRHTALPAPGGDDELCRLVGRVMGQPLDRQRPLWEVWLVEGLEGGGWALVCKVHHCMVDGIAGVGLLTVLLDLFPDAELPEPAPWAPAPEPSGVAKVLDAWGGALGDAARWAARVPDALADPVGTGRALWATTAGVARFVQHLGFTTPTSLEGPIGPHRAWRHSSASLADVAAVRKQFGGTINDVVLAAVSAGYRALLEARGEDPDHVVLRSGVPVSVRRADAAGAADNRVSTLLYELPVDEADPVARLRRVQTEMAELKGSHMAEAGEVVTDLGNLAPPLVVGPVSRGAQRLMHRVSQRSVNTVTTNVPGPQFPLYCLGREMLEYRPYVPISHGVRVGTAILSYNGRLFFGVTGDDGAVDRTAADDVGIVAEATAAEVVRLRKAATRRRRTSVPGA